MRSHRYVHPEFGLLLPTPRLRHELRMAFFSVLFGIGVGAAAVIALTGNKTANDARIPGVSSASVISEEPTEALLSNEVKVHTGESDGTKAQVNSENQKPDAATTCEGNNLSCSTIPPHASKPRAMRAPAGNDALAIGPAPLGRPDASAGMTSAAPLASSERVPEDATAGRSQQTAVDQADSNRLSHKRPSPRP
jgi:hypothetical protein